MSKVLPIVMGHFLSFTMRMKFCNLFVFMTLRRQKYLVIKKMTREKVDAQHTINQIDEYGMAVIVVKYDLSGELVTEASKEEISVSISYQWAIPNLFRSAIQCFFIAPQ